MTGYERDFHANIKRIAAALERIATVAEKVDARDMCRSDDVANGAREVATAIYHLKEQLT